MQTSKCFGHFKQMRVSPQFDVIGHIFSYLNEGLVRGGVLCLLRLQWLWQQKSCYYRKKRGIYWGGFPPLSLMVFLLWIARVQEVGSIILSLTCGCFLHFQKVLTCVFWACERKLVVNPCPTMLPLMKSLKGKDWKLKLGWEQYVCVRMCAWVLTHHCSILLWEKLSN